VSFPPAIVSTPAAPNVTSSRRDISTGAFPASAIRGRNPAHAVTHLACTGGVSK
jgi:hypothetical protein